MDREIYDRAMRKAATPHQRVAWFGALLAKESGLGDHLVIVGGSAIEIYTEGEYVSHDVDVVGNKDRMVPVLRRWGFSEEHGRDRRVYWFRAPLGLVDLVGRSHKAGLPGQVLQTQFGPVRLGALEDLVVRRLLRAGRERSSKLYDEAMILASRYASTLDWEYIESLSRYERVLPLYRQLRGTIERLR